MVGNEEFKQKIVAKAYTDLAKYFLANQQNLQDRVKSAGGSDIIVEKELVKTRENNAKAVSQVLAGIENVMIDKGLLGNVKADAENLKKAQGQSEAIKTMITAKIGPLMKAAPPDSPQVQALLGPLDAMAKGSDHTERLASQQLIEVGFGITEARDLARDILQTVQSGKPGFEALQAELTFKNLAKNMDIWSGGEGVTEKKAISPASVVASLLLDDSCPRNEGVRAVHAVTLEAKGSFATGLDGLDYLSDTLRQAAKEVPDADRDQFKEDCLKEMSKSIEDYQVAKRVDLEAINKMSKKYPDNKVLKEAKQHAALNRAETLKRVKAVPSPNPSKAKAQLVVDPAVRVRC